MVRTTKNTFFYVFLFLSSFSMASGIKGNIKNASQKKTIYLYEYFGELIILKDSAQLSKNGNFQFDKKNNFPRGLYKIGFSKDSLSNIVLSDESIEISGSLPNIQKNISFINSEENQSYKEFSSINFIFSQQVESLQKQFEQLASLAEKNQEEYNTKVNGLRLKYDSLNKSRNKEFQALSAKKPNSFTSKIALSFITTDTTTAKNYFSKTDYSDIEMTRGDLLSNKIKTYFQLYVQPQEQALASAANDLLLKMPYGTPNREVAFISMLSLFNQFQLVINKQLKTQYKSEYPKSVYSKDFLPTLRQDAPDIGDLAPNIMMADTLGKTTTLESFRGKVVLIDFWASWCGPCRMENPNVVRAFNKYKEKGFTVFSVSLDNNKEKWMGAIKKDNLTWTHVSELKGWETSASRLYQVTGIPATFLIDKEGKIVGRNLRGPALEEMLEKLLRN